MICSKNFTGNIIVVFNRSTDVKKVLLSQNEIKVSLQFYAKVFKYYFGKTKVYPSLINMQPVDEPFGVIWPNF